jgi:hypothetical protein
MGRCRVEARNYRPTAMCRRLLEPIDRRYDGRLELIGKSVRDWRIQPDDVLGTVLDFRPISAVRVRVVRFEMTVDESLRVVGVRLVRVQRRERGGERQERRDHRERSDPHQQPVHVAIIVVTPIAVKRWAGCVPLRKSQDSSSLTSVT